MGRPPALSLVLVAVIVPALAAAPADDPTLPARQFIDGFNTGDIKTAYAAYAPADVSIIDEFAPHFWVGPNAARRWAADYARNAKA